MSPIVVVRLGKGLEQKRKCLTADSSGVQSRVRNVTVLWRTVKWEVPD